MMVTEIREVKITVYVDTNHATHTEEFSDIDEAKEYLEELLEALRDG